MEYFMMEHSLGHRNVFRMMSLHNKESNTVDYRQYVTSRLYQLAVYEEPVAQFVEAADSDVQILSESQDSDTELDDNLPELDSSTLVLKTETKGCNALRECKVVLTQCVVPHVSVKRKGCVDEVITPKLAKKVVVKVAKVVTVADDGYNLPDDVLPVIVHRPRTSRRHRNFTTRQQNDSFGVRDPSTDSPAYTRAKTTSYMTNVFALFDM
jgi:hypothetical protein